MAQQGVAYKNFPLHECYRAADLLVANGAVVHQKFTCEKCGHRMTIIEPNAFHETGQCGDCNHITDLRLRGCNYLVIKTL